MSFDTLAPFPGYTPLDPDDTELWTSTVSVKLGALVTLGYIDFDGPEWDFDAYDEEQRDRLWTKFHGRYFNRELGITPAGVWHMRLMAHLNEIMPKYKFLYEALANGQTPLQAADEYHKRREIRSDFPQTMLSGNSDYASAGTDLEYETVMQGDFIETVSRLVSTYKDVDSLILDELGRFFSVIYSTNMNAI